MILPRDGYSWTGYIWLLYLGSPIWYLVSGRVSGSSSVILTAVAITLFLPLYFWGFWLEGRRALLPIAGIAAIALALCPINPGGFVFFVYASSFAGRVGRPARGTQVLGALAGLVVLEASMGRVRPEVWRAAIPLIVLVGGLSVVFAEIGRAQVKLRRAAQEDAQRLAVVAERERIGRDLHDLLGHTLTVITLKAELAAKLSSRDTDRSIAEIRDIERISRDALAEVRHAVEGYRAANLAAELRRAREALETAGLSVESSMTRSNLGISEEQALTFAVREAVTNVIRHARARTCVIQLEVNQTRARLEIHDDGIGGAAPEGSGLSGMRQRVERLGGQMERDGRHGTRLTITVPVSATPLPASESTEPA